MISLRPSFAVICQSIFSLTVLVLISHESSAQVTQLKYTDASYSGNVANGPLADAVTAQFVDASVGSATTIKVTASFSDQQFKNVAGISSLNGNFFGGTSNDESKTVQPSKLWSPMSGISDPANTMFTANTTTTKGEGFDVSANYGFNMFTSVEPLYAAGKDRGGRFYYSTLTLTFNRAVSNPVLHVAGLGGFTFEGDKMLGYATELELQNMDGLSLAVLSGNEALKLDGNKIVNGKVKLDAFSDQSAATGSIRINGSNITQLVFKIYLRGDNQGGAWSTPNFFAGDQWMLSVSMNSAVLSGNVFNDGNGLLGQPVNTVDGKGIDGLDIDSEIDGSQSLFVHILNSDKKIIKTAAVANDGGYLFQDVPAAVYNVVLSMEKESANPSLPTNWVNTGENLGATGKAGNDGKADGYIANILVLNGNNVLGEVNFGINKKPTVQSTTQVITQPVVGQQLTIDGSSLLMLKATDYEDGQIGEGGTLIIKSLSDGGKLAYNGAQVAFDAPIENLKNNKLHLTISNLDSNKINFEYTFMDKAGNLGTTGIYQLTWSENKTMVSVVNFSAKKKNRSSLLTWSSSDSALDGEFDVEYSRNGDDWSNIGQQISSVDGQSKYYSFVHDAPAAGVNVYRIKTIGADGTFNYSPVQTVNFESAGETFVYPNPAVDVISVKVDGSDDLSNLNAMNIYDATGKLVLSPSLNSDKVDVNALRNGFYIVQFLKKNGQVSSSKMSIKR